MMTVAIQENLGFLKEGLEKLGYEVVYFNQINTPVDACIYYEEDNDNSLLMVNQQLNNVFTSVRSDLQSNSNSGILLINAKNKTIEEIHQILTNRTYSPLF